MNKDFLRTGSEEFLLTYFIKVTYVDFIILLTYSIKVTYVDFFNNM